MLLPFFVNMLSLDVNQWPVSGLATSLAVAVTLYLILFRLSSTKTYPEEPPIITSPLPFIGHLLGMALQGGSYIKSLG